MNSLNRPFHINSVNVCQGGSGVEVWEEQQRLGIADAMEERRLAMGAGRALGVGRSSRVNPPGIQTLPRGRGHNPHHRSVASHDKIT